MTALAGVGSKLEAMQERLERNEAGIETMAEHLKSAVESLRMAEAAAAEDPFFLPPLQTSPMPFRCCELKPMTVKKDPFRYHRYHRN